MSEFVCASPNHSARSASLSALPFLEYTNTASTNEYQGPDVASSWSSKVKKREAGLVFCLYKFGKDHNLASMIYLLTSRSRGDLWGRGRRGERLNARLRCLTSIYIQLLCPRFFFKFSQKKSTPPFPLPSPNTRRKGEKKILHVGNCLARELSKLPKKITKVIKGV